MGSFQKEWLIYFNQAENYEYSDWLYFLRTGFKHCGGLTYNAEADQWVHLEFTHAGTKLSFLSKDEVEDILGRQPVKPNQELLFKNINNKNILITGAGGSIGSELCRQISTLNPTKIVLIESSEHNL